MRPGLPPFDVANVRVRDVVLGSKHAVGQRAGTDLQHFLFRQLGLAAGFSLVLNTPIAVHHLPHVFLVRTERQVRGVAAAGVIAGVENV